MNALRKYGVSIIWIMALVLACVNLVAMARRAPIMATENQNEAEQAAQEFARLVRPLPVDTRIALHLSPKKDNAEWFRYRLSYLVYPHRLEAFRTAPPPLAPPYLVSIQYGTTNNALLPNSVQIGDASFQTVCPPANKTLPIVPLSNFVLGLRLFLIILLILFIGMVFVRPRLKEITLRTLPAHLALAHLCGMALVTWGVTLGRGFNFWGLAGLLLLASLLGKAPSPLFTLNADTSPFSKRLPLMLLTLLGVGVALFWGNRLGLDWDGYAIWQLKAKAFFHDGNFNMLKDSVHFEYAHLDYPLLLPLQTWLFYSMAQVDLDWIAQFSTLLFYIDLLVLFYFGVRSRLSPVSAWAGTALVATLPLALQHATSGFADVPFAAYLLALTVALANGYGNRVSCFLLFGLLNTKNEGIMAGGVLLVVLAFTWLRTPKADKGEAKQRMLLLFFGIVAGFLPWYLWKHAWSLQNDITSGAHTEEALSRVFIVILAWIAALLHFGPRFPCWGLLAGLLRFGKEAKESLYFRVAVGQMLGYSLIYLITPHDVHWHIQTSMDRLLIHLAPLLLISTTLTDAFGKTTSVPFAHQSPLPHLK